LIERIRLRGSPDITEYLRETLAIDIALN